MNTEERRLLSDFLAKLNDVKGITKDVDAEDLIKESSAKQPDALYLLVQKALVQEQALNGAKARIEQLQSENTQLRARSEPSRGSFLGGNDPWAVPARPAQGYAPQGGPANWQGAPQSSGFGGGGMMGGGGMGSFLGSAAATAAGIAGGAFIFQGIENMMGHHSGGGFFNSGMDSNPIENVTINEYYGSDHPQVADNSDHDRDFFSADSDQIQTAEYEPDDSGYDDFSTDDSGSF